MDPKSLLLLSFVVFRCGRVVQREKEVWSAEHEPRRFKTNRNTSLFLTLQSTGPELTSLCLKGWCDRVDDVFVVPYQYLNWQQPTDTWLIQHFSKMIAHSRRLPQQAQWYMFAFDNNYFFVDRLINELSRIDSHLPIYTVLRDPSAEFFHKPVVIFSRFALHTFFDQESEKCSESAETFDDWLLSCMTVPSINMSLDRKNKSRVFAIKRSFQIDEMKQMKVGYHDDKQYIHSHSGSLLSFTNISVTDAKLLPIFVEKVKGGPKV